jgi:hypothetical protein
MERHFTGRCASPGIALGPLVTFTPGVRKRVTSGAVETEADALRAALTKARHDLRQFAARSPAETAEILGFQIALLEDDVLAEPALAAIAEGSAAHDAWQESMDAEAAGYEASGMSIFAPAPPTCAISAIAYSKFLRARFRMPSFRRAPSSRPSISRPRDSLQSTGRMVVRWC